MHEKVMEVIVGKDIYIDTSCVAEFVGKEVFKELLKAHQRDRVLFASDSPWNSLKGAVLNIKNLDIDDEYKEMIFCQNAKKLLGI